MEFPAFKCDECGAIKQEVNHWWKLQRVEDGIVLRPFATQDCPGGQDVSEPLHLCGTQCVLKAISKAMEER
jgi:hypothetical protein